MYVIRNRKLWDTLCLNRGPSPQWIKTTCPTWSFHHQLTKSTAAHSSQNSSNSMVSSSTMRPDWTVGPVQLSTATHVGSTGVELVQQLVWAIRTCWIATRIPFCITIRSDFCNSNWRAWFLFIHSHIYASKWCIIVPLIRLSNLLE